MKRELKVRVKTRPLPLSRASAAALARADSYDWIVFTSKHAVRYFEIARKKQKTKKPVAARIAAVGHQTAAVLRRNGYRVSFIPKHASALDVAKALPINTGATVLFPRSVLADAEALRVLRARGASVRAISLYSSFVPHLSPPIQTNIVRGAYTHLSFTSPSGVTGFLKQLPAREKRAAFRLAVICIGATTATAARDAGFEKVVISGVL